MTFAPPRGRQPSIEWVPIGELSIDPSYQRSIDTTASQKLIRAIAAEWDWDVLDILKVSRRPDDSLYLVDGQHRRAAAMLRNDIPQLPCVLKRCTGPGEEARLFIAANRGRKAINHLDDFRAAVAGDDVEAAEIVELIRAAGLSIAPHTNFSAWRPGMISNVGGIARVYRNHGAASAQRALTIVARAFEGQVLRYAGTLFVGVHGLLQKRVSVDDELLVRVLHATAQLRWYCQIGDAVASGAGRPAAATDTIAKAYDREAGTRPALGPTASAGKSPMSFEQQLEAVRNGAQLVDKFTARKTDPDYTLGGVGSAML